MYFADLSSYSCFDTEIEDLLNIGWLDKNHPFPQGEVSRTLREKLLFLAVSYPYRVTRGLHKCGFCDKCFSYFGGVGVDSEGDTKVLGSAEIRIAGRLGISYAAPDMIYHYVAKHRYLPPEEFLLALADFDPAETPWPDLSI